MGLEKKNEKHRAKNRKKSFCEKKESFASKSAKDYLRNSASRGYTDRKRIPCR